VRSLIVSLGLAVAAFAQAPPVDVLPVDALPVDGAIATAVGVLWRHGYDHDLPGERGLAQVLAEVRLAEARSAADGLFASGARVGADHSLVFAVVSRHDVGKARAFVEALLATETLADDDALRLTIARVALAADDALFLYPGSALRAIGRGNVFGGPARQPVGGLPCDLQRLTPARVRAALREPAPLRAAALGAVDDDLLARLAQLPWPDACAPRGTAPPAGVGERALEPWRVHTRVDSPFVAVSFAAPSSPDELPAFALAVEVARMRLARALPLRGSELIARAPLVSWSWLDGDAVVQFCRRGEDPEQLLPGQQPEAGGEQEADATRRELTAALQALRETPPTPAEVADARARLATELRLPAPRAQVSWATVPALYPGKLMLQLLRPLRGVDVAKLDTVTEGAVARQLQRFAPGAGDWYGFLPAPRSNVGFRAR